MPSHNCPFPFCTYATTDISDALAATMLTIHASGMHTAAGPTAASVDIARSAPVEKVKRPTIAAAGSNEDWSYFQSRWTDYTEATKVTGKDRVIQPSHTGVL